MAVVNMTKRPFVHDGWHYTAAIGTGATGSDIRIPSLPLGKTIHIALIAGANTGKFQVSSSSDAAITAGTATWSDLTLSSTTGTVRDVVLGQITGLRGVSISGEIVIEVVI